jgi:hypothetical protein
MGDLVITMPTCLGDLLMSLSVSREDASEYNTSTDDSSQRHLSLQMYSLGSMGSNRASWACKNRCRNVVIQSRYVSISRGTLTYERRAFHHPRLCSISGVVLA